MSEATELGTCEVVFAATRRHEPHRHGHTGNRVLLHAHLNQPEAVDHVFRRKMHQYWAILWQVQLVDRRDVVFRIRIGPIQTKRVVGSDLSDIGPPEPSIGPRIMDVPRELLAHNPYHHGFAFRGEPGHARGPGRDRVEHEQDPFDDGDSHFDALRDLAFRTCIARPGIRPFAKAKNHEEEKDTPTHEEHGHQPVHQHRHLIDLGGVCRRLNRHSEEFQH